MTISLKKIQNFFTLLYLFSLVARIFCCFFFLFCKTYDFNCNSQANCNLSDGFKAVCQQPALLSSHSNQPH